MYQFLHFFGTLLVLLSTLYILYALYFFVDLYTWIICIFHMCTHTAYLLFLICITIFSRVNAIRYSYHNQLQTTINHIYNLYMYYLYIISYKKEYPVVIHASVCHAMCSYLLSIHIRKTLLSFIILFRHGIST